jgi:dipeptidyl aminopeptidase/acylaminoacyl peptidase
MSMIVRSRLVVVVTVLLAAFGCARAAGGYSLVQYMSVEHTSGPTFHPSGEEVVYLSNITGVPQAWRQRTYGGYPSQVTFDTSGVDGVWWSPRDPGLIVVSAAAGGNERTQLYLTDPYGGPWQRITTDDSAIHAFGCWSRDGSRFAYAATARNGQDFDVYEYNVDAQTRFLIHQGPGSNSASDYSPDHRYLLIVHGLPSSNNDLYLYDRETGKTRLLTAHPGDVMFGSAVWDGEGRGFYLLTDQGREFVGLAYWPLDSATFRWVETPEGDVEQFALSHDGKLLAWTVNENGLSRFHFRDTGRSREIGPTRLPEGVVHDLVFSNDGAALALTLGSSTRPNDVWIYETARDRLRQITFSATGGIPAAAFRAPEIIEYESFDGRKIPAYWYLPSDVKGKLSVVVAVHGGPEDQARPRLNGLYQYWLSRGYAILEPNIRGSIGYGKSYAALDNVHNRADAVKDVAWAANWLKARPDVDGNRLAIYGAGYGGYVVLAQLTEYPDLWAAGVDVCGIADFVSFLQNAASFARESYEAEYGSLNADSSFLVEFSPLTHVDHIKAPLFVIQGANDPRVHTSEADQMVAAIKASGGTVEYMVFDDEGHGLLTTRNRIRAYSAASDFLDKYLMSRR